MQIQSRFPFLLIGLIGCTSVDMAAGVSGGPSKTIPLDECIEFDQTLIDFGTKTVDEQVTPRSITVSDTCGLWEQLETTLDDPDAAFSVLKADTLEVTVDFDKNTPGDWEAQWSVIAPGDVSHFTGSVTLQLFGNVAPSEQE